jgi:uncharacterized phage protein (TIGR02216 family)
VKRIAWSRLMRLGLVDLGLAPAVFWELTPAELLFLAGIGGPSDRVLTRSGLEELMARFPDSGGVAPWDEG